MLYTVAVVLLILWLLGLVTSYTMGGFIHILIVVAIVAVLLRIISGRQVPLTNPAFCLGKRRSVCRRR
ncbi:MAG: lmo0937 family membrane protein [Sulfuritalea sp.]|nr:lmo0937 family membrane protein [Sulfuritalea sp.]